MLMLSEKKCNMCGEVKPITEFYMYVKYLRDGTASYNYRSRCKKCWYKPKNKTGLGLPLQKALEMLKKERGEP